MFIYKKTLTDFKADVFRSVLRKDYKSFNSENTAEYISNLTNDINMLESRCIVPSLEMIGDGISGPIMWIMNKTTILKGIKEVVNKLLNIIKVI